jgi:DNA-binding MarR family transcriptional regulator
MAVGIDRGDDISKVATGLMRVSQVLGSQATAAAGFSGLSALQVQVLNDLISRGGPLTVSHFARRFQISTATVSDSIRVLTEKGLVAKVRDRADARAMLVSITEKGRETAVKSSIWTERLKRLVAEWEQNRQDEVLSALTAIIVAFQKEGVVSTDRICVACRYFAINCEMGESAAPHYCRFFNTPLRATDIRIDCPEFETL